MAKKKFINQLYRKNKSSMVTSRMLQEQSVNAILADSENRTLWINGSPFGNAYVKPDTNNTYDRLNSSNDNCGPIHAEIFNDFENNKAEGNYSHSEGIGTETNNLGEHAEGKYNYSCIVGGWEYTNSKTPDSVSRGTISTIGIGKSNTDRKNAVRVDNDGAVYIAGIQKKLSDERNISYNPCKYDGRNLEKETKSLQEVISDLGTMQEVTYTELRSLIDNSELIPGMQYRITDYGSTDNVINGDYYKLYKFVGNQFDIIVVADNENTLNKNARACHHNFKKDIEYVINNIINANKSINKTLPDDNKLTVENFYIYRNKSDKEQKTYPKEVQNIYNTIINSISFKENLSTYFENTDINKWKLAYTADTASMLIDKYTYLNTDVSNQKLIVNVTIKDKSTGTTSYEVREYVYETPITPIKIGEADDANYYNYKWRLVKFQPTTSNTQYDFEYNKKIEYLDDQNNIKISNFYNIYYVGIENITVHGLDKDGKPISESVDKSLFLSDKTKYKTLNIDEKYFDYYDQVLLTLYKYPTQDIPGEIAFYNDEKLYNVWGLFELNGDSINTYNSYGRQYLNTEALLINIDEGYYPHYYTKIPQSAAYIPGGSDDKKINLYSNYIGTFNRNDIYPTNEYVNDTTIITSSYLYSGETYYNGKKVYKWYKVKLKSSFINSELEGENIKENNYTCKNYEKVIEKDDNNIEYYTYLLSETLTPLWASENLSTQKAKINGYDHSIIDASYNYQSFIKSYSYELDKNKLKYENNDNSDDEFPVNFDDVYFNAFDSVRYSYHELDANKQIDTNKSWSGIDKYNTIFNNFQISESNSINTKDIQYMYDNLGITIANTIYEIIPTISNDKTIYKVNKNPLKSLNDSSKDFTFETLFIDNKFFKEYVNIPPNEIEIANKKDYWVGKCDQSHTTDNINTVTIFKGANGYINKSIHYNINKNTIYEKEIEETGDKTNKYIQYYSLWEANGVGLRASDYNNKSLLIKGDINENNEFVVFSSKEDVINFNNSVTVEKITALLNAGKINVVSLTIESNGDEDTFISKVKPTIDSNDQTRIIYKYLRFYVNTFNGIKFKYYNVGVENNNNLILNKKYNDTWKSYDFYTNKNVPVNQEFKNLKNYYGLSDTLTVFNNEYKLLKISEEQENITGDTYKVISPKYDYENSLCSIYYDFESINNISISKEDNKQIINFINQEYATKGLVTYMIDEYNNECCYDFKNIQFSLTNLFINKYSTYLDNKGIAENSVNYNFITTTTKDDKTKYVKGKFKINTGNISCGSIIGSFDVYDKDDNTTILYENVKTTLNNIDNKEGNFEVQYNNIQIKDGNKIAEPYLSSTFTGSISKNVSGTGVGSFTLNYSGSQIAGEFDGDLITSNINTYINKKDEKGNIIEETGYYGSNISFNYNSGEYAGYFGNQNNKKESFNKDGDITEVPEIKDYKILKDLNYLNYPGITIEKDFSNGYFYFNDYGNAEGYTLNELNDLQNGSNNPFENVTVFYYTYSLLPNYLYFNEDDTEKTKFDSKVKITDNSLTGDIINNIIYSDIQQDGIPLNLFINCNVSTNKFFNCNNIVFGGINITDNYFVNCQKTNINDTTNLFLLYRSGLCPIGNFDISHNVFANNTDITYYGEAESMGFKTLIEKFENDNLKTINIKNNKLYNIANKNILSYLTTSELYNSNTEENINGVQNTEINSNIVLKSNSYIDINTKLSANINADNINLNGTKTCINTPDIDINGSNININPFTENISSKNLNINSNNININLNKLESYASNYIKFLVNKSSNEVVEELKKKRQDSPNNDTEITTIPAKYVSSNKNEKLNKIIDYCYVENTETNNINKKINFNFTTTSYLPNYNTFKYDIGSDIKNKLSDPGKLYGKSNKYLGEWWNTNSGATRQSSLYINSYSNYGNNIGYGKDNKEAKPPLKIKNLLTTLSIGNYKTDEDSNYINDKIFKYKKDETGKTIITKEGEKTYLKSIISSISFSSNQSFNDDLKKIIDCFGSYFMTIKGYHSVHTTTNVHFNIKYKICAELNYYDSCGAQTGSFDITETLFDTNELTVKNDEQIYKSYSFFVCLCFSSLNRYSKNSSYYGSIRDKFSKFINRVDSQLHDYDGSHIYVYGVNIYLETEFYDVGIDSVFSRTRCKYLEMSPIYTVDIPEISLTNITSSSNDINIYNKSFTNSSDIDSNLDDLINKYIDVKKYESYNTITKLKNLAASSRNSKKLYNNLFTIQKQIYFNYIEPDKKDIDSNNNGIYFCKDGILLYQEVESTGAKYLKLGIPNSSSDKTWLEYTAPDETGNYNTYKLNIKDPWLYKQ